MASTGDKPLSVDPSAPLPPAAPPPGAGPHDKQQQQQQRQHDLDSSGDEDGPEPAGPADYKRLGRERPAVLPSLLIEAGFVATIVLSMMLSEYFIGGFNIVLPPLADALAIPPASRTWPAGVTNLTTAALLQPFARMCDLYGARLVFLAGHAWLLVWSLVSGFSTNATMLILCRAMQGIGAAAFLPAGLALLSRTYRPGPRKNFVFSVYGAFACIGFYFGIFMGAVAAEYLDWRWYFWIGAVLGLLIALAGLLTVPRCLADADPHARMDWWGVLTIVPGLVLVVFAFTDGGHAPDGWRTPYIYVTLGVGLVFLAAAVYVQGWVASQPLLPPDLFKHRCIKRLMGALFCSYGVFGLFLFYASFYIEVVMHTPPILTAAWFTPLAVGGMFLAIGGGLVLHIIPNRLLMIISCGGFFLSTLLFALLPDQAASGKSTSFLYWAYIFPAMLAGTIGVDITFNVTNVFITTAMPRRHQAAASGLINSLLYLGIAFWLGIGELAVSATVQSRGEDNVGPREQYQIGFWTGVALSAVSFCLTVTVKMGQAEASLTADEKAELERETNTT
ncbi:major facilitator superfamily protein [Hirsutella rhossiliensis]|uniref:Major facilitator superfamily domain-containing protein n=1 Tax=Hirsutella rhossiliensis TaxID=111463 RepID=A0A9P8N7H6_9HYPO|nr:major facilitator superfamily domain-containing protein [Hirsutella rhossiliensis]KAH0968402.1 major facilitator superfamily domain-containing protein [Hirsutella rhossiliensis]